MDEQDKKDKKLSSIQNLINPVVERALSVRENYIENYIDSGNFYVSKAELELLNKYAKISFYWEGEKDKPLLLLGMNVVEEGSPAEALMNG